MKNIMIVWGIRVRQNIFHTFQWQYMTYISGWLVSVWQFLNGVDCSSNKVMMRFLKITGRAEHISDFLTKSLKISFRVTCDILSVAWSAVTSDKHVLPGWPYYPYQRDWRAGCQHHRQGGLLPAAASHHGERQECGSGQARVFLTGPKRCLFWLSQVRHNIFQKLQQTLKILTHFLCCDRLRLPSD